MTLSTNIRTRGEGDTLMSPDRSSRPWRRSAALLIAAGALLATACSSDDAGGDDAVATTAADGGTDSTATTVADGGEATTTTTVDASAALGEENPAAGDPVTIGYVFDGTTDTIDNAAELEAAEAAAQYVNEYLGGIGGRPIELSSCSTDQTPTGATNCANQFISDGVAAVLNGVSGQGGSVYPAVAEAGIPVFVAGTLDQPSLGAEHVYVMTNGIITALAGPAQVAADDGITTAAIIVIDVPAASGPISQAAPIFYGNAGVTADIVAIPPDAPDLTPQVQAEVTANNPGQFAIVGDPPFCAKAINAIESVGFTGNIVVIPQCIEQSTVDSANVDGLILLTATTTDPDSEEFALYNAVLDTYAPDTDRGGVAPGGYQAVVGFARAVAGLTGDVTAATIDAAILAMPATPMPLADGITFQCDRQQVSIAAGLCSTDALTTVLDADGNPGPFEVLHGAELLTLG
jgi:branched-chain amino acid transport system substrate-binding protein